VDGACSTPKIPWGGFKKNSLKKNGELKSMILVYPRKTPDHGETRAGGAKDATLQKKKKARKRGDQQLAITKTAESRGKKAAPGRQMKGKTRDGLSGFKLKATSKKSECGGRARVCHTKQWDQTE